MSVFLPHPTTKATVKYIFFSCFVCYFYYLALNFPGIYFMHTMTDCIFPMLTETTSIFQCALLWCDFATSLSRGGVHFTTPLNWGEPEIVLANTIW